MRLPLAAVLLFVAGVARAQELGPVDWIFLVDTSKSMRGVGGTQNIWRHVKASIDSFLREAGERDSVALYAFDQDVRKINAASRPDLYRELLLLEAEGTRTHLGAAILTGLDHAAALRPGADPSRTRVVVLFTDGREDVRGIENPTRIDASVNRVGDTFVYFVSMGEHELQLDEFAAQTERVTVLKAPTPESIRNVALEIRKRIPKQTTRAERVKPPPPPPPPGPFPWPIVATITAALLALAAFLLIHHRRKQNRLEGEIEILRPRATPDAAYVGLPKLQANEVALSSILPVDALAGSDARLFVRRKDGRKKVWISAQNGPLRINDVETPLSELYDSDTIEIGDAKLRFNRVGDERPLEFNQEGAL
jgi:von Willebrand factor type A domain